MSWLRAIPFLFTLLAFVLQPASASALGSAHPEARVSAFGLVALASVGASAETSPGLHEGIGAAYDENASGYRFAARGASALPRALQGGEATSHVYFGVRNGERVYVGITNNIARRQTEHGARFVLERVTQSPVTRGEARAIEQALINRNPGFENIRNSISPNHSWYGEAVEWGEAWLKAARY
jgi:hypothetical protein